MFDEDAWATQRVSAPLIYVEDSTITVYGVGRQLAMHASAPKSAQVSLKRPPQTKRKAPRMDTELIQELAECGLDWDEIRLQAQLPEPTSAEERCRAQEALRCGRISGRARLKRIQYEAALEGNLNALSGALKRLSEPVRSRAAEDEPETKAPHVVRRILRVDAPHD